MQMSGRADRRGIDKEESALHSPRLEEETIAKVVL